MISESFRAMKTLQTPMEHALRAHRLSIGIGQTKHWHAILLRLIPAFADISTTFVPGMQTIIIIRPTLTTFIIAKRERNFIRHYQSDTFSLPISNF
jgi:hypothetical protein